MNYLLQFCIWGDSIAKNWSDIIARIENKKQVKLNVYIDWIAMEKALVKWVPGPNIKSVDNNMFHTKMINMHDQRTLHK